MADEPSKEFETKLEAPGEIKHLGWVPNSLRHPPRPTYLVEWSCEHEGNLHALRHEMNEREAEHKSPEELKEELIRWVNNLYREGQILRPSKQL